MAWEIVREIFQIQGRPDDAKIDVDILVEMYLVRSREGTKHIRDLRLPAEVAGERVPFLRQDDLSVLESNGKRYAYGFKGEKRFDEARK